LALSYTLRFEITSITSGGISPVVGGVLGNSYTSPGIYEEEIIASFSTITGLIASAGVDCNAVVDNISVKLTSTLSSSSSSSSTEFLTSSDSTNSSSSSSSTGAFVTSSESSEFQYAQNDNIWMKVMHVDNVTAEDHHYEVIMEVVEFTRKYVRG